MPELVTKDELKAAMHSATMQIGLMIGITFVGLFAGLLLALAPI